VAFFGKLPKAKAFVRTLLVLPWLWPAWPLIRLEQGLLADPAKFPPHHMGFVACAVLAALLVMTPLRVLFPGSRLTLALNRNRRLAGVAAFVYVLPHSAFFLIQEGGAAGITKNPMKPFVLAGLARFFILLALAVTSPHRVLRAMGA